MESEALINLAKAVEKQLAMTEKLHHEKIGFKISITEDVDTHELFLRVDLRPKSDFDGLYFYKEVIKRRWYPLDLLLVLEDKTLIQLIQEHFAEEISNYSIVEER